METLRIKGAILIFAEVIAALSMWMGFRLFELGIMDKADGVAEFGTAKFWLTGAAPGLFFAAFGAGITVFAITRPFTYEQDETADGGVKTIAHAYMAPTPVETSHTAAVPEGGQARVKRAAIARPDIVQVLEPLPVKRIRYRAAAKKR